MSPRHAVAVVVTGGAALLVAGLASAGLLGGSPHTDVPATPTVTPVTALTQQPSEPPLSWAAVLAETHLDPAELPLRPVERAAVVLHVYGGAQADQEVAPGADLSAVIALDATDGEWVRLEVPGFDPAALTDLSPDGRRMLTTRLEPVTLPQPGGTRLVYAFVDLATGQAHDVSVPDPQPALVPECRTDGVAWAPDSRHVAVVTGCLAVDRVDPAEATEPVDPAAPAAAELDVWVHVVDLVTGQTTLIEHVDDAFPVEAYPSYSPDGRFLAYGIGYEPATADDGAETLRVVEIGAPTVLEAAAVHVAYGDPWLDSRTVLGWDVLAAPGAADSYVLVDVRTGERRPLGIDRLLGLAGFVDGTLVVGRTTWLEEPNPCSAALCTADVTTGEIRQWLTVPEGADVALVAAARDAIRP